VHFLTFPYAENSINKQITQQFCIFCHATEISSFKSKNKAFLDHNTEMKTIEWEVKGGSCGERNLESLMLGGK
jgi:hypothetical protein